VIDLRARCSYCGEWFDVVDRDAVWPLSVLSGYSFSRAVFDHSFSYVGEDFVFCSAEHKALAEPQIASREVR